MALTASKSADVKRCEELWFEDGTLVLRAEDTLFRVYKGILARNSSVLRDMFVVGGGTSNSDEMVDGIPCVEMHDSPSEVRHFLRFMHDLAYDRFLINEGTRFQAYIAALRLATKYDVQELRDMAIEELATLCPVNYDKFITSSATSAPWFDPILVANVARETQVIMLLPVALYSCCTRDIQYLTSGTTLADGSHHTLRPADTQTCLLALRKLMWWRRNRLLGFLHRYEKSRNPLGCSTAEQCWRVKHNLLWEMESADADGDVCGSPLHFPFAEVHDAGADELCPACLRDAEVKMEKARRDLWDALPSWFGLGNWEGIRMVSEQ